MAPKTQFTILLVEDEILMLEALAEILEDEGYKVLRAENGEHALSVLSQNGMPDLILLDMIMPVMDGWEFTEIYRTTHRERAPLIVISGAADVEQRAADVGAEMWISKPYRMMEILKVVEGYAARAAVSSRD